MQVANLSLFSVSGYQGKENLNYMCVQASGAEIYHIGLVPVPSSNPPLRLYGCVLPGHLQSTIYPTPPDLTMNQTVAKEPSKREMLSVAIEISSMPERKIKVSAKTKANDCKFVQPYSPLIQMSTFLSPRRKQRYLSALNRPHYDTTALQPSTAGIVKSWTCLALRTMSSRATRRSPTSWKCIYICGSAQSTIGHGSTTIGPYWP